jgi:glycerol-3-phosphate acyltransferase PlsY
LLIALAVLAGYLIGAIPNGYLVARLVRGIDIRQHGSGNIGATNVGRILGLKWFFVVFALDFLKAVIPVSLLMYADLPALVPEGWPRSAVASLAGLAILIGNLFPVYIGFRGGKGAATGTGVILPLAPLPTVVALTAFLVVFLTTRYVSLGSVAAATALVATQLLLHGQTAFQGEAAPITWLSIVGAALVVFRHRTNLVRLVQGTERKIPHKTKPRDENTQEASAPYV